MKRRKIRDNSQKIKKDIVSGSSLNIMIRKYINLSFFLFCSQFAFTQEPTAAPATVPPPAPIRVACIGASITAGVGLKNPAEESYPAQLGKMLGSEYLVKNFGVSGATVCLTSSMPYWNQVALANALEFQPQIVIMLMGTNDCFPKNLENLKNSYVEDGKTLLETFASLPSHPQLWVCSLPPVHGNYRGITEEIMEKDCLPKIYQLAQEVKANIIDIHTVMTNKPELFADPIHPNAAGDLVMAMAVYTSLKNYKPEEMEAVVAQSPVK